MPPAPPVDGQTFFWLFFRFDGRVGRQVYWLSILFLTAVAGVSGPFAVDPESGEVLMQFGPVQSFVYTLATICSIAVSIKRLHDLNMSGLFAIGLLFFPVALIMTLWLGFRAGNGQPNKYGWEPDVRPTQPPPTVDDDA
ncbi:MAG: DUF805 domain-containing protein [Devosiaceae bacterium]|nr:DUF805 domain-containing protein [Devosiaceae bacterium MH13]